jgi:hypothetical protein
MPTVMIQHGTADGRPLPYDGQYLKDFDFEAHDGRGDIALTPNLDEAKQFPTFEEAWEFWRTVPKCRPFRADGKANRPLTCANWEFKQVDSIRADA